MDYKLEIGNYLNLVIDTIKKLDINAINEAMNALEEARLRNASIYICGNGGSAATASHFVCDFNKGISENLNQKYNVICLNDNVPIMMAIANDLGYDRIFELQLQGKLTSSDLLIAISGSGNSSNIIKAVQYSKSVGASVMAITGYSGGVIDGLADYHLHVPIDNMQITEDIHMIFDHLIMWILSNKKNI